MADDDGSYRAAATVAIELIKARPTVPERIAAEVGWLAYKDVAGGAPAKLFQQPGPYLDEVLLAINRIREGSRERVKYSLSTWARALRLLDTAQS